MSLFVVSLIFAICQVLLTEQLIKYFEKKDRKNALIFFGAKFSTYGIAIALVVFKHIWDFSSILCGFIAGVPIAIIALFAYKTIYKKKK